jgi:hypothetical protein
MISISHRQAARPFKDSRIVNGKSARVYKSSPPGRKTGYDVPSEAGHGWKPGAGLATTRPTTIALSESSEVDPPLNAISVTDVAHQGNAANCRLLGFRLLSEIETLGVETTPFQNAPTKAVVDRIRCSRRPPSPQEWRPGMSVKLGSLFKRTGFEDRQCVFVL